MPDQAVTAGAAAALAAGQTSSICTADVGPSTNEAGASGELLAAGTAAEAAATAAYASGPPQTKPAKKRKRSKSTSDKSGNAFEVGKMHMCFLSICRCVAGHMATSTSCPPYLLLLLWSHLLLCSPC